MSDEAKEMVARIKTAAQAARFGVSHETIIGPAIYKALIAPLDEAAALIASQAARIAELEARFNGLVQGIIDSDVFCDDDADAFDRVRQMAAAIRKETA